jgi:hypothetical protein
MDIVTSSGDLHRALLTKDEPDEIFDAIALGKDELTPPEPENLASRLAQRTLSVGTPSSASCKERTFERRAIRSFQLAFPKTMSAPPWSCRHEIHAPPQQQSSQNDALRSWPLRCVTPGEGGVVRKQARITLACSLSRLSAKLLLRLVLLMAVTLASPQTALAQPSNLPVLEPRQSLSSNPDLVQRPGDRGALIVPETAFREALGQGAWSADESIKRRAADLDALANEPGALGVLGTVLPGPREFHADFIIVMRDAALAPDRRTLEAKDYFIVATELRGRSPWLGVEPRVAVDSRMTFGGGRNCCGPTTLCVPQPSPPPCAAGAGALCAGFGIGMSSAGPPEMETRLAQGLPPISLELFTLFDPARGNQPSPQILASCSRVVDPSCTKKLPLCGPGDGGFMGSAGGGNLGAGSSSCGPSTPTLGANVPKICTIGLFTPEGLPTACGGYGGDLIPTGDNFLPPGCKVMMPLPGSDLAGCTTPDPAFANAALQVEAGWLSQRGPVERCTTGGHGVRSCISCDADGNCRQTASKPPVDPTIANDKSEDANASRKPASTTVDFPADLIVALVPKRPSATKPEQDKVEQQKEAPPAASEGQQGQTPPASAEPLKGSDSAPRASDWVRDLKNEMSEATTRGDPVLLGDGAFVITQQDLAFAGPARGLEFRRYYTSRSDDRSVLGSNWRHNWDARIIRLRPDTTPSWAPIELSSTVTNGLAAALRPTTPAVTAMRCLFAIAIITDPSSDATREPCFAPAWWVRRCCFRVLPLTWPRSRPTTTSRKPPTTSSKSWSTEICVRNPATASTLDQSTNSTGCLRSAGAAPRPCKISRGRMLRGRIGPRRFRKRRSPMSRRVPSPKGLRSTGPRIFCQRRFEIDMRWRPSCLLSTHGRPPRFVGSTRRLANRRPVVSAR